MLFRSPRGDGYDPGQVMTANEATAYHREQLKTFADALALVRRALWDHQATFCMSHRPAADATAGSYVSTTNFW